MTELTKILGKSYDNAVNPEKIWHEHLTDLPTSPVRCSRWVNVYSVHRVIKWRHRIYGHDTIAILWVWHDIIRRVKRWRLIVLFK